jgi:hypothetical protein
MVKLHEICLINYILTISVKKLNYIKINEESQQHYNQMNNLNKIKINK